MKSFHEVWAGNAHECSLNSTIGKARSVEIILMDDEGLHFDRFFGVMTRVAANTVRLGADGAIVGIKLSDGWANITVSTLSMDRGTELIGDIAIPSHRIKQLTYHE
jgi:hypothetical protein